jgi:magnesium-transporting ATPase (P-type)
MQASAVGDKTRYGQTMKELLSAEDRLSPLQHKLSVLGGHISMFGYIGATFIFVAFMFNNMFWQALPRLLTGRKPAASSSRISLPPRFWPSSWWWSPCRKGCR